MWHCSLRIVALKGIFDYKISNWYLKSFCQVSTEHKRCVFHISAASCVWSVRDCFSVKVWKSTCISGIYFSFDQLSEDCRIWLFNTLRLRRISEQNYCSINYYFDSSSRHIDLPDWYWSGASHLQQFFDFVLMISMKSSCAWISSDD